LKTDLRHSCLAVDWGCWHRQASEHKNLPLVADFEETVSIAGLDSDWDLHNSLKLVVQHFDQRKDYRKLDKIAAAAAAAVDRMMVERCLQVAAFAVRDSRSYSADTSGFADSEPVPLVGDSDIAC